MKQSGSDGYVFKLAFEHMKNIFNTELRLDVALFVQDLAKI